MLYERQVDSFSRLMREARRLDSDAGIRLVGSYRGKRCMVFVSRSGVGYAAIVCSLKRGTDPTPGRRILAVEFKRATELGKFLKGVAGKRVRAIVY